jgi:hypothetical protein
MVTQLEDMFDAMKPMVIKNAGFQAEVARTFYEACLAQDFSVGEALDLTVAFVKGAAGSTSSK